MTTPPKGKTSDTTPKTMRFDYAVATGLHTEQYPAYFRIVVEGPKQEQDAVETALKNLQQQKP